MPAHQPHIPQSEVNASAGFSKEPGARGTRTIADHRDGAERHRHMQESIDSSPRVTQLRALQQLADRHLGARPALQLKAAPVISSAAVVQRCMACGNDACASGEQCGQFSHVSGGNTYTFPARDFLQDVRQDLDMRYQHTPSASDSMQFPHLNQQTSINGRDRRLADIQSPQDRSALVSEAHQQGRTHGYVALQTNGTDQGRISASPFPSGRREQHYYDPSSTFTPYPQEAQHLQGLASRIQDENEEMGPIDARQQVYQSLDAVNRGRPSGMEDESQLQSVPLIINLAEVQRSHLMGYSSNLELANQAQMSNPDPFSQVFGTSVQRGGHNVNLPGTMSATGTGAVHRFDAIDESLEADEFTREGVQSRITRAPQGLTLPQNRNLVEQNRQNLMGTFQQRFDMTDTGYAQEQFSDDESREAATRARLRSSADRSALGQMGLSRYNYRPLTRSAEMEDDDGGNGV